VIQRVAYGSGKALADLNVGCTGCLLRRLRPSIGSLFRVWRELRPAMIDQPSPAPCPFGQTPDGVVFTLKLQPVLGARSKIDDRSRVTMR